MLFLAIYRPRSEITESTAERSLRLFQNWKPPFEFRAHYARVDGRGGVALVETDRPMTLLEGIQPFVPFFEFELTPVVDINEAVPVMEKVNKWRSSVK